MSGNYSNITQYYKMDNTTNQNLPFGIGSFYSLGPQKYSLCPTNCKGLHKNMYDKYINQLNETFNIKNLSETPDKYGIYR